jgi:Lipopolysaccharide export system permease LptF/LptG
MTYENEGNSSRGVWSRAYRALLPLLPRGLRSRQGDAMVELFDREITRSRSEGGRAVWSAGMTGLADLARRGVYERLSDERRALTSANRAILRDTANAFVVTSAVLTGLFLARGAVTRAAGSLSGAMFEVVLLSIPYTAAFTIPMSVFIAVLWASTRAPAANLSRARSDDVAFDRGTLRLGPLIVMASTVAIVCLALNAELVPRANQRLLSMYAGDTAVPPTDRSMTIRELRQAQSTISLLIFASYYVCIIVGEHLADRLEIPPTLAMWSANIILLLLATITLHGARGRSAPHVPRSVPTF